MLKNSLKFILILFFLMSTTASSKELLPVLESGGHRGLIRDVVFSNDGHYLISVSDDKTMRVWDVQTGKIKQIIRSNIGPGSAGKIFAAALSPDNHWLAAGGYLVNFTGANHARIGSIRILNFADGHLVELLQGHTNVVTALAFSQDSQLLASGSSDKTVRIWNLQNQEQKLVFSLKGHTKTVTTLAFLPDGTLVSGSEDQSLILWDSRSGEKIKTLGPLANAHNAHILASAVSFDGQYILSGSRDGSLHLWEGWTGKFIKIILLEKSEKKPVPGAVVFAPNGKEALIGTDQGCYLVSIPKGQAHKIFSRHDQLVMAAAYSPDGGLVATAGGSCQQIYLWDPADGKIRSTFKGRGRAVAAVGFSLDGNSIAWGYQDLEHEMQIFNGKVQYTGPVSDKTAYTRAVDHHGEYQLKVNTSAKYGLATILEVWKAEIKALSIERNSTNGYQHNAYTFTANANGMITGGGNGMLSLYQTIGGAHIHDFTGHNGDVNAVAASPDGKYLVSGSADQTVRVWNLQTSENLLTVFYGSDHEWVAWIKSGYYTSSPGGHQYLGWQSKHGSEYYTRPHVNKIPHRPDIVKSVMQSGLETKNLQLTAAMINFEKETQKPLKIAAIFPKTGVAAANNYLVFKGAALAVAELNKQGGLLGHKVVLIELDNQSTPLGSRKAAQQALTMNVIGVIGASWSEHSLAMAPVLQKAGVPMITSMSTNPKVTKIGDCIFRVCFIDSFQGQVMSDFAINDLGAKKAVMLININSNYSIKLAQVFNKFFLKQGGQILWQGKYKGRSINFKDMLQKTAQLNPDVIFIPGFSRDSGFIIKQAVQMGIKSIFLGGDGWSEEMFKYGGTAIENNYFSTHWHYDLPFVKNRKLIKAYRQKYKEDLGFVGITLAYDATMLLGDAVIRANSYQHSKIKDALATTINYEGVTGTITMDQNGDPRQKDAVIMKFTKNRAIFIKTIKP